MHLLQKANPLLGVSPRQFTARLYDPADQIMLDGGHYLQPDRHHRIEIHVHPPLLYWCTSGIVHYVSNYVKRFFIFFLTCSAEPYSDSMLNKNHACLFRLSGIPFVGIHVTDEVFA